MLGLMKKEFFTMKNYIITAGVIMIVLIMAMKGSGAAEIGMFSGYVMAYISIFMITMIAFDEKNKWDRYSSPMPVTKKQQVLCKYIMQLLSIIILTVLFVVLCAVNGKSALYIKEVTVIPVAISIIISSIVLMLSYKFGVNKARMIFVGMIFLIVFTLKMCGLTDEAYFITGNSNMFYIISIIVAFAIYIASFCLSVHFHSNKDF